MLTCILFLLLRYMWLPFVDTIIGRIVQNETPIQFRNALYHGSNVYNAVAMFHPTALDTFGRGWVRTTRPSFSMSLSVCFSQVFCSREPNLPQ